jgi:hypothetical protein
MKNKILFFGNIYVNSRENFLRMKDSFDSIYKKKIFCNYILNIRGKFANQSINYFKKRKITSIYNLSSDLGWYHDSYCLLKDQDFGYVFCWLEDFICVEKKSFKNLLDEISQKKIDIINYTYPYIISDNNKNFKENNLFKYKTIFKKEYNKLFGTKYIISYGSIINRNLFFKIILKDDHKIWDKKTPFGFEKNAQQKYWLPLKIGYLKKEIFCSIDDDNNKDYKSLQSRGLYPIRTQKRTNSKHLWKYINAGTRFKYKNRINNFIKSFFLFCFLLNSKQNFKTIFSLLTNIDYNKFNTAELKLLTFFLKYKSKKIIIYTLDENLGAVSKLKGINTRIITNKIFPKDDNDIITLTPLKVYDSKQHNNRFIYNGYLIKMKPNEDFKTGDILVIHEKLYQFFFKEMKKTKYKKIGSFFITNY